MNSDRTYWMPDERALIEAVKKVPVIYAKAKAMTGNEHTADTNKHWITIGEKLLSNQRGLRKKWSEIFIRYEKIQSVIRENKVPEEVLRKHPKTTKYLDGTLSFLDPHIDHIYYVNISELGIETELYHKPQEVSLQNDISASNEDNLDVMYKYVITRDMIKKLIEIKEKEGLEDSGLDGIDLEYITKLVKDSVLTSLPKEIDSNTNEKNSKESQTISNKTTLLSQFNQHSTQKNQANKLVNIAPKQVLKQPVVQTPEMQTRQAVALQSSQRFPNIVPVQPNQVNRLILKQPGGIEEIEVPRLIPINSASKLVTPSSGVAANPPVFMQENNPASMISNSRMLSNQPLIIQEPRPVIMPANQQANLMQIDQPILTNPVIIPRRPAVDASQPSTHPIKDEAVGVSQVTSLSTDAMEDIEHSIPESIIIQKSNTLSKEFNYQNTNECNMTNYFKDLDTFVNKNLTEADKIVLRKGINNLLSEILGEPRKRRDSGNKTY